MWWSIVVGLGRIALGVGIALAGVEKFTDHDKYVRLFTRWHIPLPEATPYLAGGVEIVGGVLLALGVATLLAIVALVGNFVVAFLTAGLIDGGKDIVLPLALIAGMVIVAIAGGGRWQARPAVPVVDGWLARRRAAA